ncbi:hypothetical protein M408DRAFT_69482 [Serendipita vermifera MAFF 305830]|uniref:Activator of Hsp90 ATPase AHSA1-like N-terminal domain-containing protein n=1 Tax=Serendipita vermifera MAFF 305830 TaxID=933852 RepID=A0A0C2WQV5_SERVB|nr:hypothetical protein M408DRAFT_69482 [Serendipita vermifera MAFF 305830]
MAMSSSTANWHWKTKHVSGWAKEWFTSELAGASKQDGSDTITVERLTDFDGDVEIGQRKSKLITIYDCRITLTWSAEGADNTTIKGTIVIPEVSHENTIDGVSDYTYEYSTTSSTGDSKQIGALLERVKTLLPPLLEERFRAFPQALLDTHGRDITVIVASEGNTPSGSGTVTPARVPPTTAKSSTVSSGSTTTKTSGVINTATVKVSSRFMASAEDLWGLFADENRIPMWSRAPAQSKPVPGGPFSLFSGGVTGEYLELEPPKKMVQKWRLSGGSNWVENHYGTMTITFSQDSDSTSVEMVLTGVPKGKEEEVERGLEGY